MNNQQVLSDTELALICLKSRRTEKKAKFSFKAFLKRKNKEEKTVFETSRRKFSIKKLFGIRRKNQKSLLNQSFIIDCERTEIKNLFKEKLNVELFELRALDENACKQQKFECRFFNHKHVHNCKHNHRYHHCCHKKQQQKQKQQQNVTIVNLLNNAFYESASIL